MKRLLQFFSRDDQDNEPIEYGVIAAGLTLALVVVLGWGGVVLAQEKPAEPAQTPATPTAPAQT